MSEQPKQPIIHDDKGVVRFQSNKVVTWLLDAGRINLNEIGLLSFPIEDLMQFYMLIGYSVSGFGEIFFEHHGEKAEAMVNWADTEAELLK